MDIAQKSAWGVKWSAFSRFGRQALAFVVTAVLARLLPPEAYGLLGMALTVTGFVAIFSDLGTASALIQRRRLSGDLTSSIFWVNVLLGLLTTAVVVLIAPWAALFYHEAQVTPVLRVLSFSFVIYGLSVTQQALLTRQMEFRKLARIELISSAAGAVVGIGMAASGMGVWSLVGQTLCESIVATVLSWVALPWRPQRKLDWILVRSVASYSLNLSGFQVLNYFMRNADNVLVGRYLGRTALGYYSLAYRLMLYPLQSVTRVLGRVLFPVFSRLQENNARFRRAYLRVCASISIITFPVMLGLMAVARPFVSAAFGARWMPVANLLMILAPVGMVQSIVATAGNIYTAKGRTDWMFRWAIVKSVLMVLSFAVGLRWGVVGVAAAYAIATWLVLYPNFAIPFRLVDFRVRDLFGALWPTLKFSLMMLAAVVIWEAVLAGLGVAQPWVVLVSSVLIGSTAYVGLLLWRLPPVVRDVVRFLPQTGIPWLSRAFAKLEDLGA